MPSNDKEPPVKGVQGVKVLATKLRQDFEDSNLEYANVMVDKIEVIKNQANTLPIDQLKRTKEIMTQWKESLQDGLRDPGELASGDMAACSGWYSSKVEKNLRGLLAEFTDFEATLTAMNLDPFEDLGQRMKKAMDRITPTVKGLADLPGRIQGIANEAEERDDQLRNTDTKAMKKSLDTAEMYNSLETLASCQVKLPQLVDPMQKLRDKVADFVSEAPDKIRDCFIVPSPCCCMTPYVQQQAPRCLMELLELADLAMQVDWNPFDDMLVGLRETFYNLDTSTISKPAKQFSSVASERLNNLDKLVAGAKPSGNYCLLPLSSSKRR